MSGPVAPGTYDARTLAWAQGRARAGLRRAHGPQAAGMFEGELARLGAYAAAESARDPRFARELGRESRRAARAERRLERRRARRGGRLRALDENGRAVRARRG